MSTVTGVDFVSIPSNDLAAAREFYENVLGLQAVERVAAARHGGRRRRVRDRHGHARAAQLPRASASSSAPNAVPVALQVGDVATARADLEAKGVTFDDTIDSGVCHMAHFRDPDGNVLMLHHRYAPRN